MLSIKLLLPLIFITPLLHSQQGEAPASFNTPERIISFADFLFCSGDYYRAALEYDKFLLIRYKDTIQFKAALGYSGSGNFSLTRARLQEITSGTPLSNYSQLEYYKTYFLEGDIGMMKIIFYDIDEEQLENTSMKRMLFAGMLLNNELPAQNEFSEIFSDDAEMIGMYKRKADAEYKSPLLAGILSALIPGSGKVYTEKYLDGLFAFISTGVLAFLAYDNFEAGHDTRAWIFTGLASLFYAGNIYGSAASANEFNVNVNMLFDSDLRLSLEKRNYFTPVYDFCK